MWNKTDSKLLFEARQALDREFSQARSHKPLWEKISMKLQKEGCKVTWKQCENKFKSLKREYSATVDHNNKSGNVRKECPFFDELNELFGFKAASRPKFTIGSIQGESQQSSSDEQIPVVAPSKIKPKRKSSQVTEWLQSYEERQVDLQREKMEMQRDMHKEKMSMMEKLLNAIEKKNT